MNEENATYKRVNFYPGTRMEQNVYTCVYTTQTIDPENVDNMAYNDC